MSSSAVTFHNSLAELVRAARLVGEATSAGATSVEARALDDAVLMATQRTLAEVKRYVDACAAVLAGETVRRSSVGAGLDGLARREGFRTPEALVRGLTGSTSREAATLVRVGGMLNDAEASGAAGGGAGISGAVEPWLVSVGAAVASGALSIAFAEAISAGLGRPGPGVSVDALSAAAIELVETITAQAGVDADGVLRMARDARDLVDAEGVTERERQQRVLRSFRRHRQPDGMTCYRWVAEPEAAAFIDDIYDKITSPRRGGPRFVADEDRARADALERDERTTEQLAADGFLELLQLAINTNPASIVGAIQPAVRVLVSARDLTSGTGRGWIEGQADPISHTTVERHICRGGLEAIILDEQGQPANLGRTQRLFSRTQRRLLSARDGGCRWPGCERPPEWAEAHHIRWWDRDGGRTDIDNGILLCRHHHLLLHDNGWEIKTTRGKPPQPGRQAEPAQQPEPESSTQYWLVPPPSIDPKQCPRPMPSKSRAYTDAIAGAVA